MREQVEPRPEAAEPSSPLIIYGAGSQAIVLAEFLLDQGHHLLAILTDFPTDRVPIAGVPVIAGPDPVREWLAGQAPPGTGFVVAIGNHHGRVRLARHRMLVEAGLTPVTAIHPTAYLSRGARLGLGCQLLCGAVVGAAAVLGDEVVLNTASSADHECVLGDGVHLGPGARLAGRVSVGAHAFVGTGAVVLPDLTIGAGAIVGAGAVVTRDVADGAVVAGVPARPLSRA